MMRVDEVSDYAAGVVDTINVRAFATTRWVDPLEDVGSAIQVWLSGAYEREWFACCMIGIGNRSSSLFGQRGTTIMEA
jgi:hypothetical protein